MKTYTKKQLNKMKKRRETINIAKDKKGNVDWIEGNDKHNLFLFRKIQQQVAIWNKEDAVDKEITATKKLFRKFLAGKKVN